VSKDSDGVPYASTVRRRLLDTPPAAVEPPECVPCKALARERETIIEQLALHEFDHDKERLSRIAKAAIDSAVETYVLSYERAIRERIVQATAVISNANAVAFEKEKRRIARKHAGKMARAKKPRPARRKRT